ncbi:hypothetical protein, partial [Citrobacter sedlakii]
NGAWGYTLPALANGKYHYKAYAVDAAGNQSATSTQYNFTVDATKPVGWIYSDRSDDINMSISEGLGPGSFKLELRQEFLQGGNSFKVWGWNGSAWENHGDDWSVNDGYFINNVGVTLDIEAMFVQGKYCTYYSGSSSAYRRVIFKLVQLDAAGNESDPFYIYSGGLGNSSKWVEASDSDEKVTISSSLPTGTPEALSPRSAAFTLPEATLPEEANPEFHPLMQSHSLQLTDAEEPEEELTEGTIKAEEELVPVFTDMSSDHQDRTVPEHEAIPETTDASNTLPEEQQTVSVDGHDIPVNEQDTSVDEDILPADELPDVTLLLTEPDMSEEIFAETKDEENIDPEVMQNVLDQLVENTTVIWSESAVSLYDDTTASVDIHGQALIMEEDDTINA